MEHVGGRTFDFLWAVLSDSENGYYLVSTKFYGFMAFPAVESTLNSDKPLEGRGQKQVVWLHDNISPSFSNRETRKDVQFCFVEWFAGGDFACKIPTYYLQDFLLRHWSSKNKGRTSSLSWWSFYGNLWYLEAPVIDIDSILPTIWNMFFHPSSKTRKICRYRRDAHHCTFCWCISPRFIIRWKYTKMTTASKINVIHWN